MWRKEEPDLKFIERVKLLFVVHWRGIVIVLTPLIFMPIVLPLPGEQWQWSAFTLFVVATFWVTEVIPLGITSFIPCVIFPITGVMTSSAVCSVYLNDSIMVFVGSLMLAYSVEQSGLHKRLAFAAIKCIGYSHLKLLLALCCVTTFVSMWISNTAATTMMIPIVFAVLKVFDDEGEIHIFDRDSDNEKIGSRITTCYFCCITYSATIGGIGTLVGTATNLVFKALFQSKYPAAPEYLSFPKFSAFSVVLMVLLEAFLFIYMSIYLLGWLRPNSAAAKGAVISERGKKAAKRTIQHQWVQMGSVSFWEYMVIVLFGSAICGFFCRSPQIFTGWGDLISRYHGIKNDKFIKDSALAMLVVFLMYLLPSKPTILDYCKAKYYEEFPRKRIMSVIDWELIKNILPFSFMFLLGGGIALSRGADFSGLNDRLGNALQGLSGMPNLFIIFLVVLITIIASCLASNVAVCNVFAPVAMTLADKVKYNPLWYVMAAGFSASFCFMVPVGTPGNLIVQNVARIPTPVMVRVGFLPTVAAVFLTWFCLAVYAPVIWPDLKKPQPWMDTI